MHGLSHAYHLHFWKEIDLVFFLNIFLRLRDQVYRNLSYLFFHPTCGKVGQIVASHLTNRSTPCAYTASTWSGWKMRKINFKNKKNNTRNWITIWYSHTVAVCRHWLFAIHINRFLDFRFHSQSHFPFRYIQINEIIYFFILPYSDIILKIHISVSSNFFQGTLTSNWEISYRNRIDIVCF